jgi:hypothetical protein
MPGMQGLLNKGMRVAFGATLSQPVTIYAVVKTGTGSGVWQCAYAGTNATEYLSLWRDNANKPLIGAYNTTFSATNTISATNAFIITSTYNTSSSRIRVNGSLDGSGTVGSAGTTGINVGSNHDGTSPFTGYALEIIIYAEAHDDAEIANVEAWLDNKWNVIP